jgi:hypothetical protein
MKTGLRQSRKEQVRPCKTPDDLSFCSRCDTCRKQSCRCPVDGACSTSSKLVDCSITQPSTGQTVVYGLNSKRQNSPTLRYCTSEMFNLLSKRGNHGICAAYFHFELQVKPISSFSKDECSLFVPF